MPSPSSGGERTKQRVAQISVVAAVGIFVFKFWVGLDTHSMGILAEAAHSVLDLLATLLTWVSLHIASRPADANHPFGHGKFENFSALLQTILLVLTAVAIAAVAAGNWIVGRSPTVEVDAWAFAVMLTSLAVDWWRSGILRRTAKVYGSDALAADALNFTSDMASSVAVLIGLGLVAAAQSWHIPWLRHADAVAALAVAATMLWLAVRLGRRTAGVLLDESPPGLAGEIQAALAGIEDLADVDRLRLRRVGNRYFVDAQLALAPATTLERAGMVKQEAGERIKQRLPESDIVLETRTRRPGPLQPFEQVQAIAQRHNLNIHDLSIYNLGSGLDVEFHLELRASLPLADAHELVSRLEADIRRQMPAIRRIVTHIEPETGQVTAANRLDSHRITQQVERIARRVPELIDCHDVEVHRSAGHLALSCHCSFPDSLPVERVHELVTQLEAEIKRGLPELFRVTIHPEPGSDNRR